MKAYRNMLRRKLAGFTLVEIMIVVLIIGILLAIAIPNFISARESARARACVANLKQIDSAKQQWLMDNKTSTIASETWSGASPTDAENLIGTYIRSAPQCPEAGTYTTNGSTTLPTCSVGANTANKAGTVNYPHILS
jgi:prepilin-type N-terminal cleavage/methylation domain-containing protein